MDYVKKHGHTLLNWFGSDSKTCSYRSSMLCIDIYGNLYPCHGFLYESENTKKKEIIGTIYDKGIIDKFFSEIEKYPIPEEPEHCKRCEATYCVSCCALNSSRSDKYTSYARWFDRKVTPRCRYFKLFGIYDKALHRIISRGDI